MTTQASRSRKPATASSRPRAFVGSSMKDVFARAPPGGQPAAAGQPGSAFGCQSLTACAPVSCRRLRCPVAERINGLALHQIDLTSQRFSKPAASTSFRCLRSLALPAQVAAAANPKSSTGRLDVFTRVIADGVNAFDQIPAGYHGGLFAEICPQTFPVIVRQGSTLSQIRFRLGEPAETDANLRELHMREQLVVGGAAADIQNGIALSVDLSSELAAISQRTCRIPRQTQHQSRRCRCAGLLCHC